MNTSIVRPTLSDAELRRFTVDEYRRMANVGILGPDERVELIGGEIVRMSPEGRFHEVLRSELAMVWYPRCAAAGLKMLLEKALRVADDYEPVVDVVVYPASILAPDVTPATARLLVEIADTSWRLDTEIKRAAYAAAGVRDYWVIDARTRSTRIHRDPRADGTYATTVDVPADQMLLPLLVPKLAICLNDLPQA
jgi:Uma2 family endonuclease